MSDYAIANGIQKEPCFVWWVPYVTRNNEAIISKLKPKYWYLMHKYGIRLPSSVDEVKNIYEDNEDTKWTDMIQLEMNNLRVVFNVYEGNTTKIKGYQ